MKVSKFLNEKYFCMDLKTKTKTEAINEVALLLKSCDKVKDFDQFVAGIFEREDLSSTGVGKAIAIPHARTDAVKDFVIAFARSKEGIEFKSIDENPVKLIFLMGTPKSKSINDYLKILAYLTRVLDRENVRSALENAQTPKDVIKVFSDLEK